MIVLQIWKQIPLLTGGGAARTLGYYELGDGGGAEYKIKSSSENYYEELENGLIAELNIKEKINVKQLGAYGDGIHDDTNAIDEAFDLQWRISQDKPSSSGYITGNMYPKIYPVYFSMGQYEYNGDGREVPENGLVYIYGESSSSVTIYIRKRSTVLFNSTHKIRWIEIRNLCISGGTGVFNQRFSPTPGGDKNVVDRGPVIEGNYFRDYAGCCIGSNCNDFPYWYINNNTFIGMVTSIGIATPGDTAQTMISNNSFIINKYHVKCMDGGRGVTLLNNDFIKGVSRTTRDPNVSLHDIWIQPSYSQWRLSSNLSSGNKCVITKNKFGGENVLANDYKIIIANAASENDDYLSSLDYSTTEYTRGHIAHMIIEKDNMFNWVPDYPGEAVVYIGINHLFENDWNIHANHIKYFVKFADPFYTDYENREYNTDATHVDYLTYNFTGQFGFGSNLLEVSTKGSNFIQNLINISNIKEYFIIKDPFKIGLDYHGTDVIKQDHYYTILQSDHWARPTLQDSTVTSSNSSDIHGTSFGNTINLPSKKYFSFGAQHMQENLNKPIYIEFDIKSNNLNNNTIEQINMTCASRVYFQDGTHKERSVYRREILLTNSYIHYCVRLNLYAPYLNTVFTNPTNDTIELDIQNFIVYASESPQDLITSGQFGHLSLHRNASHNATFRIESDDRISITFADGTVKYLTLSDN